MAAMLCNHQDMHSFFETCLHLAKAIMQVLRTAEACLAHASRGQSDDAIVSRFVIRLEGSYWCTASLTSSCLVVCRVKAASTYMQDVACPDGRCGRRERLKRCGWTSSQTLTVMSSNMTSSGSTRQRRGCPRWVFLLYLPAILAGHQYHSMTRFCCKHQRPEEVLSRYGLPMS